MVSQVKTASPVTQPSPETSAPSAPPAPAASSSNSENAAERITADDKPEERRSSTAEPASTPDG